MCKLKWKIDLKLVGPVRYIKMEVCEVEWGCRNEEDEMNERCFRYKINKIFIYVSFSPHQSKTLHNKYKNK